MKIRGRWMLLALSLGLGGYFALRMVRPRVALETEAASTIARLVPDSVRIRVEVLNATAVRGLARRGTFVMRDLGFDVVHSGNSSEKLDSTTVIVRSGRMDWGELAAQGLGGARVLARPDSSRYLDLTILLGTAWRPPPQTFHP